MNLRLSMIFSILLIVAAAYGLYLVKWEVHDLKSENTLLAAQILQEKEALTVLEAEWTYLNRPERLRELSAKYLTLEPGNGQQMVTLAQLTTPPATAEAIANESQLAEAEDAAPIAPAAETPVIAAAPTLINNAHLASAKGF